MNLKLIISLFIFAAFLSSCEPDKAYIQITNKVHNVSLENVSFDKISVAYRLLPGESSSKNKVTDDMEGISFPIESPIQFYMVRGDKKVLLKTKESYGLKKDQDLSIIIDDETEVINPITDLRGNMADFE